MKKKTTTLQEKDFIESLDAIKSLSITAELYGFDYTNNNSIRRTSKNLYYENFLITVILEAFLEKEDLSLKRLYEIIYSKMPKNFLWDVTVHQKQEAIIKMIRIGYINTIKKEDQQWPSFRITELGIKALQDQTFQTLVVSSFFNYQSYKLNKMVLLISSSAFVVAVISLIVALFK